MRVNGESSSAWPRMAEVLESAEGRRDWTRAVGEILCALREAIRMKGVRTLRSFIVCGLEGSRHCESAQRLSLRLTSS